MPTFLSLFVSSIVFAQPQPAVKAFTPQGYQKSVEQVRIEFAAPMVKFGDTKLAAPAQSSCFDSAKGEGRWIDTRNWVFDFKEALPGGVACDVKVASKNFKFNTGGPHIKETFPVSYRNLEPDQNFVLIVDAPVKKESLAEGLYFVVEGLGDRIPAQIIEGADAEKVIEAAQKEYKYEKDSFKGQKIVVKATRTFAPEAKVSLVWSKKIQSEQGASSPNDQTFEFSVAENFKAKFSCEREVAEGPCVPLLGMSVQLSKQISLRDAQSIYLEGPQKEKIKADGLDEKNEKDRLSYLQFKGPFKTRSTYTVIIPPSVKDEDDQALSNQAQFPLRIQTGDDPALLKFASSFGLIEAGPQAMWPLTLRRVEKSVATEFGGWTGNITAAQFKDVIASMAEVERNNVSEKRLTYWQKLKAEKIKVPKPQAASETEVIGIPLKKKGYYLVEMKSPLLGQALTGEKKDLYVRAAALVTDMAVHVKFSARESWVWVTELANGKTVADAKVKIYDVKGNLVAESKTDAKGLAYIQFKTSISDWARNDGGPYYDGFFAVAEKGDDFSFSHSSWDRGIESWRFQIPSGNQEDGLIGHAILDRTLFKPEEKMSAKIVLRKAEGKGLYIPPASEYPTTLLISHDSGLQSFKLPLKWNTKKGTTTAQMELPAGTKLGRWTMSFERKKSYPFYVGEFSVENFRVPLVQTTIHSNKPRFVQDKDINLQVQSNYFAGGPVADLAMKMNWSVEPNYFDAEDDNLREFTFANGTVKEGLFRQGENEEARHTPQSGVGMFRLNKLGSSDVKLSGIKYANSPQMLRTEVEYKDPSGETKTAIRSFSLWPSNIVLGMKAKSWSATRDLVEFDIVALDLDQRPQAKQNIAVDLYTSHYYSHRKRLVGGFYAYEDFQEFKKVGELCKGTTDTQGLFVCKGASPVSGSVIALARTKDRDGKESFVQVSQWIVKKGENQWFGSQDNDRADLIPFKKSYEPGETAEFQLRTPFPTAKVLLTVERDGVLYSEVVDVKGDKSTIKLPIKKEYAPNVVVSAFAIRGRLSDPKPTALVDLGKPAFKLGMTSIKVGWKENTLKVAVSTDRKKYKVREKVQVKVRVTDDSGKPAAQGEIALVAVDEGLLELRQNKSWDILSAMMKLRSHNVQTATAQSLVIGKRHFGLKAVPAGGDGGGAIRRELFDTLLYWNPAVTLDKNGEASVAVTLNDSTTSFRFVAIALQGADQFGSGWTSIQSSQDLIIMPGLAGVTRQGDDFMATFTIRNASEQKQDLQLSLETSPKSASTNAAQKISLEPGAAKEVFWKVKAPVGTELSYVMTAKNSQGKVLDEVKKTQKILTLQSPRIFQSEFGQWPDLKALALQQPVGALAGQSSIIVEVNKSLGGSDSGIREFWKNYVYSCLEQQISRAVSLQDKKLWQKLDDQLSTYMDGNGLLRYFPRDTLEGSVNLTIYVTALAHEAGFKFSEANENRLLDTLSSYAEGRLRNPSKISRMDEALLKISAFEVLSRYRRLNVDLLSSVDAKAMTDWPLYSLVEWYQIHLWEKNIPQRDKKLAEIESALRSRFYFSAKRLQLRGEDAENMSWLMRDSESSILRLILATSDQATWKQDTPRLVQGILSRQQEGSWGLTTTNAWGSLVIRKLQASAKDNPVTGVFTAELEKNKTRYDWKKGDLGAMTLPWAGQQAKLQMNQEGSGKPYITVSAKAAVPVTKAQFAGFNVEKTITAVEQKKKGVWSVGDIARVQLKVRAKAPQTWVVVEDPIPAGSSLLQNSYASAVERKEELIRLYFDWFPSEEQTIEYTLRFNQAGTFHLPMTRVEAMYSPDLFAELPEGTWKVQE